MILEIDVAANGRLTLSAEIRKHLGVESGGVVRAEIIDDRIILRSIGQSPAERRAIARK